MSRELKEKVVWNWTEVIISADLSTDYKMMPVWEGCNLIAVITKDNYNKDVYNHFTKDNQYLAKSFYNKELNISTSDKWLDNRCIEIIRKEQERNRKENLFLISAKKAQSRFINDVIKHVFSTEEEK